MAELQHCHTRHGDLVRINLRSPRANGQDTRNFHPVMNDVAHRFGRTQGNNVFTQTVECDQIESIRGDGQWLKRSFAA